MTIAADHFMALVIDKNSQQPIYYQVMDFIKEKIASGEWEAGFRLPPEDIFAQELAISRGTLRKAIKLLVDEKVLETVHGKGTFVRKVDIESEFLTTIFNTAEQLNWFGLDLSSRVLEQKILPCEDEKLAEKLKINLTTKIIFSRKLYSQDGKIISVQDTYVPVDKVAALRNVNKLQGVELYYSNHKISYQMPPQPILDIFNAQDGESFVCDFYTVMDDQSIPIEYKRTWFRNFTGSGNHLLDI